VPDESATVARTSAPTGYDTSAGRNVSRSRQLHEAALTVLPGGTSRAVHQTHPHPLYAREGRGCEITDVDGNRYLDFYNNASSLVHGHAHAATMAAIVEQSRLGTAFSLPVERQIELASILCDRIPSAEQVRFVNSGSEAVLLAIRAARALTGRPMIAKFEGLYHGCADAVEMSVDPDPQVWGRREAPTTVPQTRGTPPGVVDSVMVLPFNDVDAAEAILRAHADELAAVIIDVLPMRLGVTAATSEWLTRVRRVTAETGVLLISDEVVTFRLAYGGPQALLGFDADLTVLGKMIGGGLPVGAVLGPRDIMQAFDGSTARPAVPNAGTFNANPMTLAAGTATLTGLPASEIQRINELGDTLRRRADSAFAQVGLAAHTTGTGSLFGVHMTDRRFRDYREYWHASLGDPDIRRRQRELYDRLLDRGVLFSTAGVGSVSTAMTENEIETFVAALQDAAGDLLRIGR
jgi:glutamate-1-semialdehyde 2,1-aminomutase